MTATITNDGSAASDLGPGGAPPVRLDEAQQRLVDHKGFVKAIRSDRAEATELS